jgi:hypothetical protein
VRAKDLGLNVKAAVRACAAGANVGGANAAGGTYRYNCGGSPVGGLTHARHDGSRRIDGSRRARAHVRTRIVGGGGLSAAGVVAVDRDR